MSDSDRGQVLAGRLLGACQLTGAVSLLGGGIAFAMGLGGSAREAHLVASGVLFLAAALAFGLAANAVLRR